ncbi:DEAD/DEAH box helicase [Candidatus Micrarchaeota archaeon]|nr:DEAD/DEAH box helicase [Candidatus Micrarchaeota archaeon]
MLEDFSPIERTEPARKPVFSDYPLQPFIKGVFEDRGITKLYEHQAKGIQLVKEGKNVVVVAPTAGGKSEVFIVPAVEAALRGESTLLLYPTKALARDQLERLLEFRIYGVRTEVYDGDTSQNSREKIRANPPQVIISNVDMLHFILLHNRLFTSFFEKLKYVVLDEIHIYSGVLGSHVYNILWRLKRLMRKKYKREIQFIATSATVGNAKGFAEEIVGEKFELVEGTSSPRSEYHHFIINPEDSYLVASLKVAQEIGKKALIFGNSHSTVERMGLIAEGMGLDLRVYRSGLSQEERRNVEKEFKEGKVRFLASTSALELGMDIGDTDVVILAGFPGTVTRVKQRLGRSGRKGQQAYGVFVAKENPLDQYYVENPDQYLYGDPENCFVNPKNGKIRKSHILSAAKDMMYSPEEIDEDISPILASLEEEGMVKKWGSLVSITKEGAKKVRTLNIRGIGESVRIFDSSRQKFIGERDSHMAIGELFEGAIYLHGGRAYMSQKLDLEGMTATVEPLGRKVEEYTHALRTKEAEVVEHIETRDCLGHPLSFGKVHIVDTVYGFAIKDAYSSTRLGEHHFETPYIHEFDTYAIWLDLDDLVPIIQNFGDGLHAFEHVSISMMPAITGADPKEIGGISYPTGRMYVYDGVPDGNGITRIVFNKFEAVAQMALDRFEKCTCEKGCPKCILDPMCGNDNRHLSKEGGKIIAEELLKKH